MYQLGLDKLVKSALPCQFFPLRVCMCQLCACMFLAAHQIAVCLVHVGDGLQQQQESRQAREA